MRLPKPHQYPKVLYINNEEYYVRFHKRINRDSTLAGICDPKTKLIKIKLGMDQLDTFKTFIHEVMHAIEFEYDSPIPHKTVYDLEGIVATFFICNF